MVVSLLSKSEFDLFFRHDVLNGRNIHQEENGGCQSDQQSDCRLSFSVYLLFYIVVVFYWKLD
jgi:hypothetical protein